jgi:hypothetical protein
MNSADRMAYDVLDGKYFAVRSAALDTARGKLRRGEEVCLQRKNCIYSLKQQFDDVWVYVYNQTK